MESGLLMDENALAAEIARLQAELGVITPHEYVAATVTPLPLQRVESQIDYVADEHSLQDIQSEDEFATVATSDDDDGNAFGCSYDEITVQTDDEDFMNFMATTAASSNTETTASQPQPSTGLLAAKLQADKNAPRRSNVANTTTNNHNNNVPRTTPTKATSTSPFTINDYSSPVHTKTSLLPNHHQDDDKDSYHYQHAPSSPPPQQQHQSPVVVERDDVDSNNNDHEMENDDNNIVVEKNHHEENENNNNNNNVVVQSYNEDNDNNDNEHENEDLVPLEPVIEGSLEEEIMRLQQQVSAPSPPPKAKRKKKILVRKTRKKSSTPAVQQDDEVENENNCSTTAEVPTLPLTTVVPAVVAPVSSSHIIAGDAASTTGDADYRPRSALPSFLSEIQQRGVKPPSLLAAIQQKRRPDQEEEEVTLCGATGNSDITTTTAAVSGYDEEAERLQAEILRMQAELAAVSETIADANDATNDAAAHVTTTAPPPTPPRPPMFSLLGAIEQAATKRVQRLEETGGELIMQDIAPEVKAQEPSGPRQLSTSMAEMISARAAARDKRLADGGEKRMRKVVIKEKDEYKKDFSNIVTDAAAMGRLTRLNEHTVEAIAQEKTPQQEWKSNGLLAIQWRSNHMAVIHEAARAGNEFKLPEHVVSNFPEEEQLDWDPETSGKPISSRMRQLLELDNKVGEGQQKVDKLVLGRKEEQGKPDNLLIKPMQAYSNIEDVQLPRSTAPRIDPKRNAEKLSSMMKEAVKGGRPMIDISAGVAEIAWARRARLDRPGSLPKVREVCPCPYCGTASPYQTFAYRELDRKHKEAALLHRQEQLRRHEERQRRKAEAEARGADAAATAAVVDDNNNVVEELDENGNVIDEIERKRRERQRMREETRKLKQAVADAEAAVAEAQKAEDHIAAAQQQHNKPAPTEKVPSAKNIIPSSTVQDRVDQWKNSSHSAAAESPYAQQPPPPVDAGCKCVIM